MKWFTKKKDDGSLIHYNDNKIVRDVSDDNDVITFATPIVEEERIQELEKFEKDIIDDFIENPKNATPEEIESAIKASETQEKIETIQENKGDQDEDKLWKDVTDEIIRIKEDDTLATDDKLVLLFNLHEGFEGGFPKEIEMELINLMAVLDARLQKEKKDHQETQREEKARDKIQSLKNKVSVLREKTRKPSSGRVESYQRDDDTITDWDGPYAVLIAEAELA